MAWFKVDDQLAFHSKTMLAGNEAMGLWVRAGSWSSAHFTNGFIPEHMALAMAPPMANSNLPSDAIDLPSRLVEAGFWHKVEGGYQFHDWDDFQPDGKAEKERQEKIRKERSEAGKKGAAARWGTKNDDGKTMAQPIANAIAKDGTASSKPMAPSRPVPSSISKDADDATENMFNDWYKDYPKKVGKGQARKAFKAALKKTDLETLKAGLAKYLKTVEGKDKEFIANPATWLNGERWDDDYSEQTSGDDSWNKLMNWTGQN